MLITHSITVTILVVTETENQAPPELQAQTCTAQVKGPSLAAKVVP